MLSTPLTLHSLLLLSDDVVVLYCVLQEAEQQDDDSYLRAEWANPRGLRKAITGFGNIRIR